VKNIQIIFPNLEIVTTWFYVKNMGILFFQIIACSFAERHQSIRIATGNKKKFQFKHLLDWENFGSFVLGAEENAPSHANLSMFPKAKFCVCPPPIDKPAKARFSRSF
jgi:hypothetical protein